MIYENGQSPFFGDDFGIGSVMFAPNCDDAPEDRAVKVSLTLDIDADEEEVDQRLETWAGLPCLPWFRFHLADLSEFDVRGLPSFHVIHGYLDAKTALELKSNSVVYQRAYGDRTPHDG